LLQQSLSGEISAGDGDKRSHRFAFIRQCSRSIVGSVISHIWILLHSPPPGGPIPIWEALYGLLVTLGGGDAGGGSGEMMGCCVRSLDLIRKLEEFTASDHAGIDPFSIEYVIQLVKSLVEQKNIKRRAVIMKGQKEQSPCDGHPKVSLTGGGKGPQSCHYACSLCCWSGIGVTKRHL